MWLSRACHAVVVQKCLVGIACYGSSAVSAQLSEQCVRRIAEHERRRSFLPDTMLVGPSPSRTLLLLPLLLGALADTAPAATAARSLPSGAVIAGYTNQGNASTILHAVCHAGHVFPRHLFNHTCGPNKCSWRTGRPGRQRPDLVVH